MMIINADAEGRKTIHALCDVALKVGGLQNLRIVNAVMASTKPLLPKEVDPPQNGDDPNPAEAQE